MVARMNEPLVSVSLPVYNRAEIVRKSIDSILAQTFRDFELIIVDDGSTDDLAGTVAFYNDDRMRIVRHEKNHGLYAARNTGIKASRGKYIAFHDSDDVWHSKKLEEEIALLKDTPANVGGVYSQIEKTYRDGTYIHVPPDGFSPTEGNLMDTFLRGDFFITMQALMVKRECFDAGLSFDASFPVFGDGDFIIQFSKKYDLVYNPNIRVTLTISEDSISRNTRKRVAAREKLFLKEFDLYKRNADTFALNAYRIGKSFEGFGDNQKARKYLGMAAVARPFSMRYVVSWLRALVLRR